MYGYEKPLEGSWDSTGWAGLGAVRGPRGNWPWVRSMLYGVVVRM